MAEAKKTGFIANVVALLKGDDDKGLAKKIHRTAKSSVKMQIAALENEEIKKETEVENAEEAYHNAIYPTDLITNTELYTQRIVEKKEALDAANEALETVRESIEFFKGLQSEISAA